MSCMRLKGALVTVLLTLDVEIFLTNISLILNLYPFYATPFIFPTH